MRTPIGVFRSRSLCLWIVCPETGGVRKFRLSLLSIAGAAFAVSFLAGLVSGALIDYSRLHYMKKSLVASVHNATTETVELKNVNEELTSRLEGISDDNKRYRSFEEIIRRKLTELENLFAGTVAVNGIEKSDLNLNGNTGKVAAGGAEIRCGLRSGKYRSCRNRFLPDNNSDGELTVPSVHNAAGDALAAHLTRQIKFIRGFPLGTPVRGSVSSGYGWRKSPFSRGLSFHKGTDFTFDQGRSVYSTADGVVKTVKWDRTYGRVIDLDHGSGLITRYAHLSRNLVHEGERVERGTKIGIGGSTGLSTGPHLHYEIRLNRRARNPEKFMLLAGDIQRALLKEGVDF